MSETVIAIATSTGLFVMTNYKQDAEIYQIIKYEKFVSCVRPLTKDRFAAVLVDYKENNNMCELQYRQYPGFKDQLLYTILVINTENFEPVAELPA